MIKIDIAIIGLGITSKLAALALASENCKVLILGQENPKSYDSNLVTFLSLNSIEFLKSIGVKTLVDESVPINEISCSKLENYQSNNKFQINFKDKNEMGRVVLNSNLSENLDNQIKIGLNKVQDKKKILIAYEPVWSIGTGLIPKSKELYETINFIKKKIKVQKILYGGSVNPKNIDILKSIDNLDGFLIGGASQDSKKFIDIIKQTYI